MAFRLPMLASLDMDFRSETLARRSWSRRMAPRLFPFRAMSRYGRDRLPLVSDGAAFRLAVLPRGKVLSRSRLVRSQPFITTWLVRSRRV
eukprot:5189319-Prorocentrum_lima.AAC.1